MTSFLFVFILFLIKFYERRFFYDSSSFVVILGALLAVSEALALIPSVKSNSVFQMVCNVLARMAGRKEVK